jgi:hypothetical protein
MAKVKPAYRKQVSTGRVSQGSVSRPAKLPKWNPQYDASQSFRRVKAPL